MLQTFNSDQLAALIQQRPGEVKLGERMTALEDLAQMATHPARFAVIGIAEDIGIRANLGRPGAAEAFDWFLPALLNLQDNRFMRGEDLLLAGVLRFTDLQAEAEELNPQQEKDLQRLREMTAIVDREVQALVGKTIGAGKIPLIVGGGHNNAYGNICGTASALARSIPVLNIDPHADFRRQEGRHSGNGFRYAFAEGKIEKYAVFGLQESYNNAETIELFRENANLFYVSFDELLTFSTQQRDKLFRDTLNWLGHKGIALELDLDSVSKMPVSALNPSGLSMRQTRTLVKTAAALAQPHYFHLCEAAPPLAANEELRILTGKSLAVLVADFVKSYARFSN